VIAGWNESSIHDEYGVLAEPLVGPECEQRAEAADDAVG
jgi:hypothetical protein